MFLAYNDREGGMVAIESRAPGNQGGPAVARIDSPTTPDADPTAAVDGDIAVRNGAIVRSSLPEQVANRLRDMIVQNELLPGDRIRERTISTALNVSRTPLREALQVLAAEGLVDLLPNRGAVVADPSPDIVRQMLEVQAMLEWHAGRSFCANAGDEAVAEVRALHYEMLAAYSRRDRLAYFKLNQRIHRAIIENAGNVVLSEMHGMLSARLYRFRYQPNLKPEHWESAVAEHDRILCAVEARDAEELGAALSEHLQTTWRKLSAMMTAKQ